MTASYAIPMTQNSETYNKIVEFVRTLYPDENPVALHAPRFLGREKEYLAQCIDSTFVSYVGEFVGRFEAEVAAFTGARFAVATSTGTAALHVALILAGVRPGDLVVTQPVTFVATANAIAYVGCDFVFLDVEQSTLGLSPDALEEYFTGSCERRDDGLFDRASKRRIAACIPVHVLGHPARIDRIQALCRENGVVLVEDAAESLGSYRNGRHTGTFGHAGVLSFNGNKTITCGGGGMLITNDEQWAKRARHITTTAKKPHRYEFDHDEIGYNYRLTNINAAVGLAQLEQLPDFLADKRDLAQSYREFLGTLGLEAIVEPSGATSNYWLNSVLLADLAERNAFLDFTNNSGVMTRPLWKPMNRLPMYRDFGPARFPVSDRLADSLVCLPSSYRTR